MAAGIELCVAGQSYRVNSSESEETLRSLAAELETHVASHTVPGRQPPNGVLLLAALRLVHELRHEKAARLALERKTRDLLRRALLRIEHALEAAPPDQSKASLNASSAPSAVLLEERRSATQSTTAPPAEMCFT